MKAVLLLLWKVCLKLHLNAATGSMLDFILTRGRVFQSSVVAFSCGRGAVGVAQHGVEGAGEVVGQCAAVVLLGQRHQAGQDQQHEEEQVEGEGRSEDPVEEGPAWGRVPPLLPGCQGKMVKMVISHKKKNITQTPFNILFGDFNCISSSTSPSC